MLFRAQQLQRDVDEAAAAELVRWLADRATHAADPAIDPPMLSRDPDDDYLIALASVHRAALVSGDKRLLALDEEIPVFSPRAFIGLLAEH